VLKVFYLTLNRPPHPCSMNFTSIGICGQRCEPAATLQGLEAGQSFPLTESRSCGDQSLS
jgi:hypothetical protein